MTNRTSYVYDERGNVTWITNALNGITQMEYDQQNHKTNEVVFLAAEPYATNRFVISTNGLLLAAINALGHSNTYLYGPRGRLEVATDARGFSTTNYYEEATDLLLATRDALGNVSSNYYDARGRLVGTRDPLGMLTTNFYDELGNLTATATLDAFGVILSTNSFDYDLNGNRTHSVTWRLVNDGWTGATNTMIYDAQNRVVQTIAPDGGTNTVVYNPLGKQDCTVDALGRTNRFEYDAQGRLFKTVAPDGSFELLYFDAEGRVTNRVDRANRATLSVYDALGRVTQTIYADNTTNRTVYDGLGRVQFTVDARGVTNAFGYDRAGRRVAVTNAWGTPVQTVSGFGYDENGNQTYVTNALGVITTNVFDVLNRQVQTRFDDGTKTAAGHDALGRRVAETNQDDIVTLFGYDGLGRLTAVTNAVGTAEEMVTRYEYDQAGNLVRQVDALGRTNRFEYDSVGRRTKRTLPGGQAETFGYDLLGNLIRHTNFNGVIITNEYNSLNRLTNRMSANGYQVRFGYSPTGRRASMVDASGTTTYAYDLRDRLTNCVNAVGELHYRYDEAGNLTNLWSSTANGVNVRYGYDSLNRLKAVTNVVSGSPSLAALYGFDGVGNLQSIQYGNNVTNLYRYDSLNRLTNLVWKLNTTTLGDFTYKLGLVGNRTNLSETVNGVGRTYAWQYDALYRLTNETISVSAPTGTLGYGFDAVGNRLSRSGTLGSLGSQSFNYDKGDRLDNDADPATASSWFDANGNTTSYGGNYQYDVMNRLTNANSGAVVIVYDGDGNRIKKTAGGVTTWYLVATVNPSGWPQVVEEKTGTTPSTLARVYSYGLDLVSQREAGGTVYYFGSDGHGSTRFLTDGNAAVANAFAYDAYGTLIASNSTPQTAYLYTGEQFDSALGFYYLRERYYNAGIGRFQTSDLFEGFQADPQSLHRYTYCHNSPNDHTDPSGESLSAGQLATIGIGLIIANITWNAVKPAFQDRTVDNPDAVGPAGGWEGMVPVWGTGRDALDEFQNGEYMVGTIDVFFAATDVVTIGKGVFLGLTKGGAGIVIKATGKGAAGKRGGMIVLKNSGKAWPKHHIFPQAFRSQFKRIGIDIDKFTLKIPPELHSFLHAQGDRAFPGGIWNSAWDDFFKMNPNATVDDVYKFAAEQMTKYGLSDYAIVSYR